MELATSFNPDRTLKVQTPGAQAGPAMPAGPTFLQGLDPNLISQLLAAKLARNAPQVQAVAPRAAMPPSGEYMEHSRPRPQLGAGMKKEDRITRMVSDPRVSPYHKMATGQEIPTVQERYIPGVGWEFDGIQGRGSSGGRGSIETQSAPSGGFSSESDSPAFDPRMMALRGQQEAARPMIGASARRQQDEIALKVPRNSSVPRIGRG